jgi:multidrug efflux system outer membrane protein
MRSLIVLARPSLALAAAFALAGCAMGPDYRRPAFASPAKHRGAETATPESVADTAWWGLFRDRELQGLIREALANNRDLGIAATRVDQARAVGLQANAGLFPQLGYQALAGTGRNSFLGSPAYNAGASGDSFLGALNLAWEIDFWGRVRRESEAARAQILASEYGVRGVTITVVSAVAGAYFELLSLDLELEISRRSATAFDQSLKLFGERFDAGVASRLEVSRAEAALATTRAAIPEIERQIVLKENQINVLLGRAPQPIRRRGTLLAQNFPARIPAGIPAQLLDRRPDLLIAEQNLIAANALIGATEANWLPAIGLTTLAGAISPELSDLTKKRSALWSAAGGAAGPVFDGGRILGGVREARARFEEAKLAYEGIALNALREVSDAIVSRAKFNEVRARQSEAVTALKEAVSVSSDRFLKGESSYYEVLEAQQQLFPTELSLARAELGRRLAVIELYRALGGGWSSPGTGKQ